MADHAAEDNDAGNVDIYVYRGGRAPQHITHARIDESVEVIEEGAFCGCDNLVYVETHNRIRKIELRAFSFCRSLPRIDIKSVVEICRNGFSRCEKLQFVEFGDKLESIRTYAFGLCSIEHLKLPSVVSIDDNVFLDCTRLIDVEFSDKLERLSTWAFNGCRSLQRIAIPLKRGLFSDDNVFDGCEQLKIVDLVGGVQQTVTSLYMESWRADMASEFNRINQILPETAAIEKTRTIRQWMDSVSDRLDYYKTEHTICIEEAVTLLELALWKAKLDEKEDVCKKPAVKKVMINSEEDVRKECRVTCGADTVIKNVLPFLQLLE